MSNRSEVIEVLRRSGESMFSPLPQPMPLELRGLGWYVSQVEGSVTTYTNGVEDPIHFSDVFGGRNEAIEVLRGYNADIFKYPELPTPNVIGHLGWVWECREGELNYAHKIGEQHITFSDVFSEPTRVMNKKDMIQCLRRDFEHFGAVIRAHQTMVNGWVTDTIGSKPSILVLRNDSGDRIYSGDLFGDDLKQLLEYGDAVNSPSHYQFFPGVEAIEIIAASMTVDQYWGYCLGNKIKYHLRAGGKDDIAQEINKGKKYVELFEQHKHLCKAN